MDEQIQSTWLSYLMAYNIIYYTKQRKSYQVQNINQQKVEKKRKMCMDIAENETDEKLYY